MPLLPLPEPPAGTCPSSHHVPGVWVKGSGAELFCRGRKRGSVCWDMNVLKKILFKLLFNFPQMKNDGESRGP